MSAVDDNGKIVLVTGSSRGIGLRIAQYFARVGYRTVMNCVSSVQKLESEVAALRAVNGNVIGMRADVSDYGETAAMFQEIEERFGGVDVLVNNAGISYVGLFHEMQHEQMQRVIGANLMSVMNCSRFAAGRMIQHKSGVIINISSIWGSTGASCEVVYSASKGGVNAFTRALAKELGPSGIRVNAIACGVIDTQMNDFLSAEEKETLTDGIPLMRFGSADEVARLAMFLASDECGYMTGQVLTVDGGMT